MTRRLLVLVGLACVLAVSGCTGTAPAEHPDDDNRLGWEGGYAATDAISVDPSDGLNASERSAVTARAMARLEVLRGLEFHDPVSTRVISREQYRANRSNESDPTHAAWNNQVWEALFLVGSDTDVESVFDDTLGSRVIGFYRPGTNEVVVVSDSESPDLSRGTLVHELVHALQDQHFDIGSAPDTQDGQLARNGVVEGEANRLEAMYRERCGSRWRCVSELGGGGGGGSLDRWGRNVFTVIYFPYAVGPAFVDHVAARGGNEALNGLYAPYPSSTEQIRHPESYPDETPVPVRVPDRSDGDWRRFDHDPVADTVGEASIYAMLRANGVGESGPRYGYRHRAAAGWGGDSLVPYRHGDEFGYVWTTAWDTRADATEFHAAYESLVVAEGADRLGDGRYRLPDDHPFRGAFRLSIDGRRVTVVHGPTADALAGIRRS
jgi:hypothetical protein